MLLYRWFLLLCDLFGKQGKCGYNLAKSRLQIVPISPVHILCKQGKCVYTLANPTCKIVPVFTVHYLCKQGEWVSTFAKTSFSNYADLQFVHNFPRRFFIACWWISSPNPWQKSERKFKNLLSELHPLGLTMTLQTTHKICILCVYMLYKHLNLTINM